jgi:ribosome-associated translation inhibitor RaiA
MQVEVSTDIPITETVLNMVSATVESGLERFQDRLTRAEVHLKNFERSKPTVPASCKIEVRPASRGPVVASDDASTLEEAVKGAVGKMCRLLDSMFGRIDSHRGGT